MRADGEHRPLQYGGVLAPEGSIGEKQKSVKNRAALLHGLAFLFLDFHFGVPRGEQPLGRAPRLGSSGTFLLLFWSQKNRFIGQQPIYIRVPPQGGDTRQAQANIPKKANSVSPQIRLFPML